MQENIETNGRYIVCYQGLLFMAIYSSGWYSQKKRASI